MNISLDFNTLTCPVCKGYDLHHKTIKVYDRQNEDGLTNLIVVDVKGEVSKITEWEENPSSRRHAVEIMFECENCHFNERGPIPSISPFGLVIKQHKGITIMEWRGLPTKEK
jgi:hypothetical protein